MDWQQWTGIVIWINASWPDQKLEAVTAKAWFEDMEHEDAGVTVVALRRLRRMAKGYRPQLGTILEACKEVRHERLASTRNPSDATRRCGTCATSPAAGWIEKPEGELVTWYPCPSCCSGQYVAWQERVAR